MTRLMTLGGGKRIFTLGGSQHGSPSTPGLRAGDVRGEPPRAVQEELGLPAGLRHHPAGGSCHQAVPQMAFWCRPPGLWRMNSITGRCRTWPGGIKHPLRVLPGRHGCCTRAVWR